MEDTEIISQWLQDIAHDVRENVAALGINPKSYEGMVAERLHDEGVLDEQVRVHSFVSAGELTVPYWWTTFQDGRGPTKNPGTGEVRKTILMSLQKNNFNPDGEHSVETVAYFIANKIHNQGSSLYRSSEMSDVFTDAITEKRVQALAGTFGAKYTNEVKSDILKELNNL